MRGLHGQGTGTESHSRDGRSGFVLGFVVLMLFAIGVAGAASYQIVINEFQLATQSKESMEALAVARGGLERFVAEQIGVVGDSVSYAIGNGVATVTSRKVAEEDSLNHLYMIRSEGSVSDIRYPNNPAKRVVGMYAHYRIAPLKHKAAVFLTGRRAYVYYSTMNIDGYDHADTTDCAAGGTAGVAGIATGGSISEAYGPIIDGNPRTDLSYSGLSEVLDSTGIRWDILSNPSFPVEFDGSPPDFGSLPADSFPVVRYNGNLYANSYWSGRGVLIVTGLLALGQGFTWDGIILAGNFYYSFSGTPYPVVNGTLVGGLGGQFTDMYLYRGTIHYNSCNVYAANNSLSYLEPIPSTLWEESG